MSSSVVSFAEDIKHERLCVKVERFVVEKELCEQTEALTVKLVVFPIHLIEGENPFLVDLLAVGCCLDTLGDVVAVNLLQTHVLQAELAHPQLGHLQWERTEVPGVDLVLSNLNLVDILDLGEGFMLLLCRVFLWAGLLVDLIKLSPLVPGDLPVVCFAELLVILLVCVHDPFPRHPLVQPTVGVLVMYVVLVVSVVDHLGGLPAVVGTPDRVVSTNLKFQVASVLVIFF